MKSLAMNIFEEGNGIVRLAPAWVPRAFCRPGKRMKLHHQDYYILGLERGGIDERWLASTTHADNGGLEPFDEGMSYAVSKDGKGRILLTELVDELKALLIGEDLWNKYQRWPVLAKFFDNAGPLPHHMHHNDAYAKAVNQYGKPEMYFFPSQMNNHGGEFPFTFFGFAPEVTKDDLMRCLKAFSKGDNGILDISVAYKLKLDTGWDVPTGLLHAPGSLCTYEPQFASDVYAMYQSVLYNGQCVPEDLLWKGCPEERRGDFDYLIEVLDWELNVDRDFRKNRYMEPKPVSDINQMIEQGYNDEWICYKSDCVSSKRLTILPGKTVTITDSAAYGLICIQGNGTIGPHRLETPTVIRYGQLTNDEFFVSESAAKRGVVITNASDNEPIVVLKHFAENPDLTM